MPTVHTNVSSTLPQLAGHVSLDGSGLRAVSTSPDSYAYMAVIFAHRYYLPIAPAIVLISGYGNMLLH